MVSVTRPLLHVHACVSYACTIVWPARTQRRQTGRYVDTHACIKAIAKNIFPYNTKTSTLYFDLSYPLKCQLIQ